MIQSESPPEELDTQVPDKQRGVEFQLFTSLLRRRGGWFANTSVEPTAYAVSFRVVMDSLFSLMSCQSSVYRLWLTSIR
jgi:hypothetical protein